MKTNEELNALKEEVETLNKKLAELSEDELSLIAGGLYGNEKYDRSSTTYDYTDGNAGGYELKSH